MTVIDLARTARVEIVESREQRTLVAAEAITPGAPVRIDTSGKFALTNAAGDSAALYGVATGDHAVLAGMAITAVADGTLDGFTFSGDHGAKVFLSDTDGRLDTAKGTTEKIVGEIVPGTATVLGGSNAKLLRVKPLPIDVVGGS